MHRGFLKFQIGKNGINDGLIENLNLAFKKHKMMRIVVLKNVVRNREKVKEMAEEIRTRLEGKYNYRIIGFTIAMKKS